jgi:outer membrane protein assembly factor BamD
MAPNKMGPMKTALILMTTALIIFSGCSSKDKKSDTAEGAFAIAKEFDDAERYEESIKRYNEVRTKFPYSKYATLAELAVADVNYKQEAFAEAQVAYQNFKDLHPKHAMADYVTFRLGMSYFKQLPSTLDRDLSLATSAIQIFDEVVVTYPQSQYVTESKERKVEALKMLAGKENYIANFYFIRDKFDSALTRYEGLLRTYPELGFDEQALARASIAAKKTGEDKKAQVYADQLRAKYPNSSHFDDIKKAFR